MFERPQIVRHAGQNLLFGQPLGERDLDRAVERQRAAMDLGQRANRGVQGEMATEHGAAKPLARDFDLFGQRDFLLPRQQRNLGHLRQIHPHRIVAHLGQLALRQFEGGAAVVIVVGGPSGAARARSLRARARSATARLARVMATSTCGSSAASARFGLGGVGDQFDAQFFQGDQQIVEFFRSDGFVGQIVVNLIVSQITLGFARGDQFLQIHIAVVHLSVPSRTPASRGIQ